MSPGTGDGRVVDRRSDVFGLGVILGRNVVGHVSVCGRLADRALEASAFFGSAVADVAAILEFRATVNAIVERALMSVRSDRYAHLAKWPAALRAANSQTRTNQPAVALAHRPSIVNRRMAMKRAALLASRRVGSRRERSTAVRPSVAVLPFLDMSPGKDSEYFGDGLAEAIINLLAGVDGLKVIARTSAFAFKHQPTDIRLIARTLGVTTVLEGSVQRAGSRVRVTAQLIAASDRRPLWSQRYDRELTDLFAVQDEIAAAIAAVLEARLRPAPARHTPPFDVNQAYMKGRHYQFTYTAQDQARSRDYFRQAIALDPHYALPHHGLSLAYFTLATFNLMPAHDAMPLLCACALKALSIDPQLPEAHAMLGMVAGLYDYDWDEARRRFDVVMATPPISSRTPASNRLLPARIHRPARGGGCADSKGGDRRSGVDDHPPSAGGRPARRRPRRRWRRATTRRDGD